MGNQFKGTLDLNRMRTFIQMAAVQPLIIVRFFTDPLNLPCNICYFHVILFILSVLNQGLIEGKVPGSTYKGI